VVVVSLLNISPTAVFFVSSFLMMIALVTYFVVFRHADKRKIQ
jgi:hypothetical protein